MDGLQPDADEMTWAVLDRLAQYGGSCESGIRALQSAEAILREMSELEQNFQDRPERLLILGMRCD